MNLQVAPFHAHLADGPPDANCQWLHPPGARIRSVWWKTGRKGTVFLLTGRTESVEKYGRAAADLVERGFSVITCDWRGQGLSDRPLPDRRAGHVGSFTEYQDDLEALLAEAERARLPKPYFLLGHSLGGSIGLRALNRGLPFKAAVFSAPMWGIAMSPWLRPVAAVVPTLAGLFGLGTLYAPTTSSDCYVLKTRFEDNALTSNREMWTYMRGQLEAVPELTLGGPTLTWLRLALRECAELLAAPAPKVPAICALGTQEKIVDVPKVQLRMAGWANGQLDFYPGAEHELMMEGPEVRNRFFDRAASLFEANR